MQTQFLLIRHGETDLMRNVLCGRMPGVPLNPQGRREAGALAEWLAGISVAAVLSSPQQRCRETALATKPFWNHEITVEPAFDEVDFGDWTGKLFTELEQREEWHAFNRHRGTASPPGGESMANIAGRALSCLGRMAAKHSEQTVAVFTHADVIRTVLVEVLQMPPDAIHRLRIAPACVSVVRWSPAAAEVTLIGGRPAVA